MGLKYNPKTKKVVFDNHTKFMFYTRNKLKKILKQYKNELLCSYGAGVPAFDKINSMVANNQLTYNQAKTIYSVLHDYEAFIINALASSENVTVIQ